MTRAERRRAAAAMEDSGSAPVWGERAEPSTTGRIESGSPDVRADSLPTVPETPAAPEEDAFDRAAQALRFTGATPVVAAAKTSSRDRGVPPVAAPPASRRRRRTSARSQGRSFVGRLVTAGATVSAMGAVGMLAVAMAAPAEAFAAAVKTEPVTSIQAPADDPAVVEAGAVQAYVAPENVDTDLGRTDETYSAATFSDIAAATGITRHTNFFVNDPSSPIQWPFAVGVPISDGYGPRWGSFHWGLDFTPGEGAEIQAVAEGTVRVANENGAAFGVHVIIDHNINGEVFATHYAHMQHGSLRVKAGDHVTAGTILGLTGNTGLSYGAHLHFEVFVNNQRIDPLPWLRKHAGG